MSSRPETQLQYHLTEYPTLQLEQLNYEDIVTFVKEKLTAYETEQNLISDMAEDIGRRADRVFLWAALTTQPQIRGITLYDDFETLL